MAQKKRKAFTIQEKSHILWRLENGEQNREIAKDCGVSHSTISTIWKNKEKIKNLLESSTLRTKRARMSEHRDIEEALLMWYKHQRANNVPINGPILQHKANDFAWRLGKENFECSSSWVQRFRARHNIAFGNVCDDGAAGFSEGLSDEWISHKWPALSEGYKPEEIFNAVETALFFDMTPDERLTSKGVQCGGEKMSKNRITVLVAANMTGLSKQKLLVIGKSKKPRCFKDLRSLPVIYERNAKAWMTSQLFEKWLRNWDVRLKLKGEKILLLVDNCPAHLPVLNLKCIKLVFLPPNVTSVLQPMDQGAIKCLKAQYRKLQILRMARNIDSGENTKSLSILDAILLIAEAWDKVIPKTIASCFRHAGFGDGSLLSRDEDDDDVPFAELLSPKDDDDNGLLARLSVQLTGYTVSRTEIQEFIEVDDNFAVCAPLTEDDVSVQVESNDCSTDEEEHFKPPSLCEAINAVTTLQKFVAFNEEFNTDVNQVLFKEIKHKMQKTFENKCRKQTKMIDYFTK